MLRFFSNMSDRVLREEVGRRLRATAQELGFPTAYALAEWLGASRAQVAAWFNALALPPVKYMRQLATGRGITLDWIYRGDGSGLPHGLYIRLIGAMQTGTPLPPDVQPEPEPAAEPEPKSAGIAHRPRKAGADGPRREPQKRATAA